MLCRVGFLFALLHFTIGHVTRMCSLFNEEAYLLTMFVSICVCVCVRFYVLWMRKRKPRQTRVIHKIQLWKMGIFCLAVFRYRLQALLYCACTWFALYECPSLLLYVRICVRVCMHKWRVALLSTFTYLRLVDIIAKCSIWGWLAGWFAKNIRRWRSWCMKCDLQGVCNSSYDVEGTYCSRFFEPHTKTILSAISFLHFWICYEFFCIPYGLFPRLTFETDSTIRVVCACTAWHHTMLTVQEQFYWLSHIHDGSICGSLPNA